MSVQDHAVEIQLTVPHELGPADAVLAELRDRMRSIEQERAAERLRTGRRVHGRRAVHWSDPDALVGLIRSATQTLW